MDYVMAMQIKEFSVEIIYAFSDYNILSIYKYDA